MMLFKAFNQNHTPILWQVLKGFTKTFKLSERRDLRSE